MRQSDLVEVDSLDLVEVCSVGKASLVVVVRERKEGGERRTEGLAVSVGTEPSLSRSVTSPSPSAAATVSSPSSSLPRSIPSSSSALPSSVPSTSSISPSAACPAVSATSATTIATARVTRALVGRAAAASTVRCEVETSAKEAEKWERGKRNVLPP